MIGPPTLNARYISYPIERLMTSGNLGSGLTRGTAAAVDNITKGFVGVVSEPAKGIHKAVAVCAPWLWRLSRARSLGRYSVE